MTIDNVNLFQSNNDSILINGNASAIDINENVNNVDEHTSTSSKDASIPSQLCVPVNDKTDNIFPTPNIDCIFGPSN